MILEYEIVSDSRNEIDFDKVQCENVIRLADKKGMNALRLLNKIDIRLSYYAILAEGNSNK